MLISLGYRDGFAAAAQRRQLDIRFVVEREYDQLRGTPQIRVDSLADPEEVLRAVLAADVAGPTGVLTGAEQALLSAAVLRIALDLPGDRDVLGVSRFRDKFIQKSALPASIPCARCEYLPRAPVSYGELSGRLGERIVLKPANGYGSRATAVIASQTELDSYIADHPTDSHVATVAEEYVDGYEIHVDGLWYQGRPGWMAVSKYPHPLGGWTAGTMVGDAPLGNAHPELQQRAKALAAAALAGLGAPDCVFHLEAFVTEEETIYFGEAAARLVGAKTPETLRLTFGVDLHDAAIDIALGREPLVLAHDDPPELYGFLYLNRDRGSRLTEADFHARFDLVECDYPTADRGAVRSYGRWGHAIAHAPDHPRIEQLLEEIAAFSHGVDRASA